MERSAAGQKRTVRHRLDDLETNHFYQQLNKSVRHRLDDLEISMQSI